MAIGGRKKQNKRSLRFTRLGVYLDGVRIEDETGERTALDVFAFVSDGDLPLAGLVRLESRRVNSVVVADRTVEDPIGRRFGFHFQRSSSGSVRIDLPVAYGTK